MIDGIAALTGDWSYECVSVGVPSPVHAGHVVSEPVNLGAWLGRVRFSGRVREADEGRQRRGDAGAGELRGRQDVFLGLGTGLGTALVYDGIVEPMELGHLPFRKATFEDYVGERGLKRLGKKKWHKAVLEVIEQLTAALEPDYVVLGGGNAKRLGDLPANVRLGGNDNAFVGGFRLWDPTMPSLKLD